MTRGHTRSMTWFPKYVQESKNTYLLYSFCVYYENNLQKKLSGVEA